jgi:hypothetical protein
LDTEQETRFLNLCKYLWPKAWQLGTIPEVSQPTKACNYLIFGLCRWFTAGDDGMLFSTKLTKKPILARKHAVEWAKSLSKQYPDDPDASTWLAWFHWLGDEEVDAWKGLNKACSKIPCFSALLAQYCMLSHKNDELALQIARNLVKTAPSEPLAWWKLTHAYLKQGNVAQALSTLNTSPMLSWSEPDFAIVKYPTPARIHLPLKPASLLDPISPGTKLEYPSIIIKNASVSSLSWIWGLDMCGTPLSTKEKVVLSSELTLQQHAQSNQIHPDLLRLPSLTLKGTFLSAYRLLVEMSRKVGWDELLKIRGEIFVMEQEINAASSVLPSSPLIPGGKGKRLCERWLDNLFMLLYQDLRLFAALQTENQHCHQQGLTLHQIALRKTPAEWEVYADLCRSLGHEQEAVNCWKYSLELRWRSKSMLRLLETTEALDPCLTLISKLCTAWQRSYGVPIWPHPISRALVKLVKQHGVDKLQNACKNYKNHTLLEKWISLVQDLFQE